MAAFDDVIAMERKRDGAAYAFAAAALTPAMQTRDAQTSDTATDQSGYWDDTTGSYKPYFQLGISKFGDGSVFK